MNTKTVVITLIVLVALAAGGFWLVNRYKTPVVTDTLASTPSEESIQIRPLGLNETQPAAQAAPAAPVNNTITPEALEQMREALTAIQKLAPEDRTKALLEYQQKMMKEKGLNIPKTIPTTDPYTTTTP